MSQQTLSDILISQARNQWYRCAEPGRLRAARKTWAPHERPLVSVLIPTLPERWDVLRTRALASLARQSYKNVQVIVIPDFPKKQHYPDEPKLHWLVGPSNALNRGLAEVKGDYIVRIDDDDILRPHMIEKMLEFIQSDDFEFVSAAAKGPDGIIKPYHHPLVGSVQTWMYRSYLKCFKYNLDSWRKSWDCNNEIDLYKRMHQAGVRMGYLPCVVCDIKPRPGLSEIGSKGFINEFSMYNTSTRRE